MHGAPLGYLEHSRLLLVGEGAFDGDEPLDALDLPVPSISQSSQSLACIAAVAQRYLDLFERAAPRAARIFAESSPCRPRARRAGANKGRGLRRSRPRFDRLVRDRTCAHLPSSRCFKKPTEVTITSAIRPPLKALLPNPLSVWDFITLARLVILSARAALRAGTPCLRRGPIQTCARTCNPCRNRTASSEKSPRCAGAGGRAPARFRARPFAPAM